MNSLTDCYILNNEVKIPCIGFGTWQTPDGETAETVVKAALEAGYRHIDTAAGYGNEESIGRGIAQSGVARDQIFVTTKLWNDTRGYEETLAAFETSRKKLGLEYLDLYLIHWPNPINFRDHWQKANSDTWCAFETLYKEGLVRSIGVSNFRPHHLEALYQTATVRPMVNQIRLCPGDVPDETVQFCRENKILLEGYSPLGTGKIFEIPQIKALSEKYNRSVAQICIRWSLQMGFLPLPKSVTPSRILENANVFDFSLTDEDMQIISSLDGCVGYAKDPDQTTF